MASVGKTVQISGQDHLPTNLRKGLSSAIMGNNSKDSPEDPEASNPKIRLVSSLVQTEANLLQAEEMIPPNPNLLSDGWERRFLTDTNRAPELVGLYEELGFEVITEEIEPDEFNSLCKDCGLFSLIPLVMIYTRK